MYNKYKIKEIAKLTGMTTEAVRYYENNGIIIPQKDDLTGYRYYTTWDIHVLLQARLYRAYGYSISEVNELINKYNLIQINRSYSIKEKELEEMLLWHIKLLSYIRTRETLIKKIKDCENVCSIEERPALYRLDTQERYTLLNNEDISKITCEFLKKTPFMCSSALIEKKDFLFGSNKFHFGLSIEKEFINVEMIQNSKDIKYYQPCLSVYTIVRTSADTLFGPDKFLHVKSYMEQKGLKLSGDVITRVIFYRNNNGCYETMQEAWFPIVDFRSCY